MATNALSQTMPTEYSFKRVRGAGDLIPRRFGIDVYITAATSLLKHAASFGFQYLVKGEIITILMLLGISPRRAHAVGVVELPKFLIKHVWSDATDDHVQELAAMEAVPTAGGKLERLINEEKFGRDGRLGCRGRDEGRARAQARIAPTQDSFQGRCGTRGESTMEEPHSPRATPPSAAASSGSAPSAVEARLFLPMAVASTSGVCRLAVAR